jgi:chromate reductase
MQKIKILGIEGSLRANSSTHILMSTVKDLFPKDIEFRIYEHLGKIPPFDDSDQVPVEVENFRNQLNEADGVFFLTPEYAFGVPGILKNALDWTVSSGELVYKPAALVVAATGGENAYQSLLLVFKALSLNINDGSKLLISFIRSKLNGQGEITDIETANKLKQLIKDFIDNIQKSSHLNVSKTD